MVVFLLHQPSLPNVKTPPPPPGYTVLLHIVDDIHSEPSNAIRFDLQNHHGRELFEEQPTHTSLHH